MSLKQEVNTGDQLASEVISSASGRATTRGKRSRGYSPASGESQAVKNLKQCIRKKKKLKARLKRVKGKLALIKQFIAETSGQDITFKEWLEAQGYQWDYLTKEFGSFSATNLSPKQYENMYGKSNANGQSGVYGMETEILRQFELHSALAPNDASAFEGNPLNTWFSEGYVQDLSMGTNEDADDVEEYAEFLGEEYDAIEIMHDHFEDIEDNLADALTDTEFENFYGQDPEWSNASGRGKSRRKARKDKRKKRRSGRKEARKARRSTRKDKRQSRREKKKQTRAERKEARKARRAQKRKEGKGFFRKIWKGIKRFNPLGVAARNGALLGIKMNAFGIATRMSPAIVPDPKFKPASVNKAKQAWKKTEKSWVKLGGKPSSLRQAVIKGRNKKPFLAKKEKSGIDGMNDLVIMIPNNDSSIHEEFSNAAGTAAAITAGLGVLTALIQLLKKNDVDIDPYLDGEAPLEYVEALEDGMIPEELPYDPEAPILDDDGNWIDPETGEIVDPTTGEVVDGTIMGIPKVPFYVGVGVLGLTAAFVIYRAIKGGNKGGK